MLHSSPRVHTNLWNRIPRKSATILSSKSASSRVTSHNAFCWATWTTFLHRNLSNHQLQPFIEYSRVKIHNKINSLELFDEGQRQEILWLRKVFLFKPNGSPFNSLLQWMEKILSQRTRRFFTRDLLEKCWREGRKALECSTKLKTFNF